MTRTVLGIGLAVFLLVTGAAALWLVDAFGPPPLDTEPAAEMPSPGNEAAPQRPGAASTPAPDKRPASETAATDDAPPVEPSGLTQPIKGRVIRFDENEGMLGGARATLELWRGEPKTWWKTQPEKPIAVTRTDAEGYYTIPAQADIDPWTTTLIVRASGWAEDYRVLGLLDNEDEREITLHRSYDVTGRVTDEHDRPVAGARVFAASWFADGDIGNMLSFSDVPPDRTDDIEFVYRRGMTIPKPYPRTVTDGDGRYRLPNLPPCRLFALDPKGNLGGSHDTGEPETVGQQVVQPIQIRPRGSLAVEVRDAAGRPAKRETSRICLFRTEEDGFVYTVTYWAREGRILCPNLRPGRYTILVWPNGSRPEKREVVVGTNAETRLSIACRDGLQVTGQVLDADGQPIADAYISVKFLSGLLADYAFDCGSRAGKDGRFAITGLPSGRLRVNAGSTYRVGQAQTVDAGTEGVVFQLVAEPVLRGRLVAPPGEAVPRNVRICSGRKGHRHLPDTGKDGSFSQTMDAGTRWVLVRADNWPPFPERLMTFRLGEVLDLGDLRKPPGRTLRGLVIGPDGEPVEHAWVQILFDRWGVQEIDRSDSSGRFTLAGLPAWGGALTVQAGDDIPGFVKRIGAHETGEQVIRLSRGGRITGTIVDARGRPAVEAEIEAESSDGDWTRATTDHEGRFRTRAMPAGRYRLSVPAKGEQKGGDERREVARVTLRDGGTAKVKVRLPD